MGTEISNLSHTVDIHYRRVDTNGRIASCRSWDGKEPAIWTTDGCRTRETRGGGGVTCQCSHLTFFAILMSPPAVNMSASDVRSLTQITSMGCGLSMLFLAGAVFVHCLKFRKEDTSQATEILMNLFAAMFALNLSFLVNESVAALGHSGSCVAMAAVMHYAMLATCTWFFTEALHLHLVLRKLSTGRRYMAGIYVTGWAPPAVVVITLLALGQYDHVVLHTDDGSSAKICWISDAVVHNGVNVGYYAAVFLFAFAAFIATVRQIVFTRPAAGKRQNVCSTNSFSIVGLLLLLGITWAFAFFSHGPLLIASYYIFTILNSFQGFFLFVYYICSRRKSSSPWDTSSAPTDAVTHSH
ncbi:adhesion G-protein coupled receptor G2-like [Pungitius pungitius]|uniref:adhesion G-protein coupled receptor G2-like n=1 Tax=Pungitius pungitius TaxID=134920 RepID=UPI002E161C51